MEGFEKIDLERPASLSKDVPKSPVNVMSSRVSNGRRFSFRNHKKILIALSVVLFLFVVIIFAVILPAQRTYASAKKTYAQMQVVIAAIKKQDVVLASAELDRTKADLTETQNNLNSMSYLRFVPIANGYYSDASHLMKAGFYSLDGSKVLVDSIVPYVDVLGLKGKGSFVGGTASQRIATAVQAMGKITPRIDDISNYIALARSEIDAVDINHYPNFWLGTKVRSGLEKIRTLTDEGSTFISDAKPLIKILPSLLGDPTEKKYLVLFQNDKELRPTGGFMTAYAIFRVDKGIIHVDSSSDIYAIDDTIPGKSAAPRPLQLYLPKVPLLNLRDSNLSPDFVTSMDTFYKMYQKAPGYTKVDGIIAVDTKALVAAMNILGDMQVDGATYSTKNDPRCDCPQVIYALEEYADQPLQIVKQNRKGIIGDLMYAIMNKAFSSSPKLYWGPLFQTMLAQTSQKHILFYSFNTDAQSGLEALNASARILSFEGDYLHINEANFGGAKSNLFVTEAVTQNYDVKSDGGITKTVTINYKNPFAPSDCNLERGNLCLNAVLRDWIRIYVPKGSQLVTSQGSEVKLISYEELGKTVFEGFLTVRPQGVAKFTITYTLPFKTAAGSTLPVLIQKQPGTGDFDYIIQVNGKQTNEFPLSTDATLKLKL
jgi:hypothetical protein